MFNSLWPHGLQHARPLSLTISQSLLKLMSTESVMPSNHLIFFAPFSSHLQSFPASGSFPMSQYFKSGGQRIGASASASSSSSENIGLISTRMDWFALHAVQRTHKSLLQNHSSKASILQHSAFFMVQLSHPHITTGKTIALTRQIFVDIVMSLHFSILSRLVTAFFQGARIF